MRSPADAIRGALRLVKPGDGQQLRAPSPQQQRFVGQARGQGVECLDGVPRGGRRFRVQLGMGLGLRHGDASENASDGETVQPQPSRRLWTMRRRVHATPVLDALPGAELVKPAGKRGTRAAPGTFGYAMGKAVEAVGVRRVMEITGLSRSAVYAGANPDDPRHFPSVGYETALLLAGAAVDRGKHGVASAFALPFLRLADRLPAPAAHSANLFHQAAHLGALYGRTAATLCALFDRAEGKRGPVAMPGPEREAAIAAIDAQIDGLQAMRALLLSTTALPPLAIPNLDREG